MLRRLKKEVKVEGDREQELQVMKNMVDNQQIDGNQQHVQQTNNINNEEIVINKENANYKLKQELNNEKKSDLIEKNPQEGEGNEKGQDKGEKKEKVKSETDENRNVKPELNIISQSKIQSEFKNIFQSQNLFFSNNIYRSRLMHLTFFSIIFDIIVLEVLCLYLNVCYGEIIEMQKWISNSIAPLCIILLLLYILLYFSSDSVSKIVVKITTIVIVITILFFFTIGLFTMGFAASAKVEDLQISWKILSKQSKIFYYNNDIQTLFKTYTLNMFITGILYLIQAVIGVIIVCFSYQYYQNVTLDWRPPLRSRLSDERAERYIQMYKMFDKDYKKLHDIENLVDENENKKLVDKNDHLDENHIIPIKERNLENGKKDNSPIKNEYTTINNDDERGKQVENNFPKRRGVLNRKKRLDNDNNNDNQINE